MKAHCLFEQSGTFKNEFKKLGVEAYDYDILNDFGETDFVVDLFAEIEKAYGGGSSLFDKFAPDDVIIAFFPCVRFEDQIMLFFRGDSFGMEKWSETEKLEKDMALHGELHNLYCLVSKLCIVAIKKNLRLIVENPYSAQHYLKQYWALKPKVIDTDRRNNGDYFRKPTQYWFVNTEPKMNLVFEPISYNMIVGKTNMKRMQMPELSVTGAKDRHTARSMIHPQYANRFIRQYILDESEVTQ